MNNIKYIQLLFNIVFLLSGIPQQYYSSHFINKINIFLELIFFFLQQPQRFDLFLCNSCSYSISLPFDEKSFLESLIRKKGITDPRSDGCQNFAFQRMYASQ